ncbi:5-formyltetrahydrofolate cyclo-ligase [Roseococcus sp. DSY-14]|uniref:5-formyltetrahydrofolate cyclo-ligase n=1 Tax=Roseococcus sp. DSY-14 TaxID=3369650 RepID=UPI00387AE6E7
MDKPELRRHALARRGGSPDAPRRLLAHLLPLVPPGAAVAGFWPLPGELDLRPALAALHARGHALALPFTPPRGQPLRFRRWAPGEALAPGPMGTAHPAAEVPLVPGVVLVPLLAFDRRGGRLGYGGGYYDRTLPLFPHARRLGIAFAAQEVDEVPMQPHDIFLHAIVTEEGVTRP